MVWSLLAIAALAPVAIAATSPLLAYRSAVYVTSGLAGAGALSILLIQPLLAAGYLPGLTPITMRRLHRWLGIALVMAVALHILGLYITSPPDTIDALTLASPTPFSVYGVIAMWSLIATALLVALRRKIGLRPSHWRIVHNALAVVVVIASVVHALLIEGTMGWGSKLALCTCALLTTGIVIAHLRVVKPLRRRFGSLL